MVTERELRSQFNRAKARGWISYFVEFARKYDFPAAVLLAIASRETNMRNIRGDYRNGVWHGYGIMQVDIGTDAVFCRDWNSDKVRESIERGVQILKSKFTYLANRGLSGNKLMEYGIAAYNGGEGRALTAVTIGNSPDSITTHKNYLTDVLNRAKTFKYMLAIIGL